VSGCTRAKARKPLPPTFITMSLSLLGEASRSSSSCLVSRSWRAVSFWCSRSACSKPGSCAASGALSSWARACTSIECASVMYFVSCSWMSAATCAPPSLGPRGTYPARRSLTAQLLAQALVDDPRVGLAAGRLHHLPDEEAEQSLLAVSVRRALAGVRGDDLVDDRVERRNVADGLLPEVGLGREAVVAEVRERVVECLAPDLRPRGDELRELGGVHAIGIDAGCDERIGEHVRRLLRVDAFVDDRRPEPVEAAGDENVCVVERERARNPPDARQGQIPDLDAHPHDELGRRMQGHEVGLRKVAVVLRLFLRAQRRRVLMRRVEVERLLLDRAAGLVHGDLALNLLEDALGGEVERVHVLELGAPAQLLRALRPDGDVDVEAHRSFLELGVGDAELDDRLAEELQE